MKIGLRVSFSKPGKSGEHPFEPALKFASKLGLHQDMAYYRWSCNSRNGI
jgi:hypothetical protein